MDVSRFAGKILLKMLRSQIFRLYPNKSQTAYLNNACGVARFAYNWALALRKRYHRIHGKSIHSPRLQRHWNKVKSRRFPWVCEVSKHAAEQAFRALDGAYEAFFSRRGGFPKFKKKGVHDAFCAGRQSKPGRPELKILPRQLVLPRIGGIRFRGSPRWPQCLPRSARVYCRAGKWFASISFEIPVKVADAQGRPSCGVDLGATVFATIASEGRVDAQVEPPKPYAKAKRRLRRLHRSVSRKMRGSRNREKAVKRLATAYLRTAYIRADFLHKLSRKLVHTYGTVVLEDLTVKGMSNGRLAGSVRDLGWGEFRRQVEYKAAEVGTRVVVADRFFPSSKRCHRCGHVRASLTLDERLLWCQRCGEIVGRDENAALNLEQLGRGTPEVTPAETGGSGGAVRPSRCRSRKRECQKTAIRPD